MIVLYSGTPGSGKSLHLADKVRSNLKFHRPVIGTFHINKNRLYDNSKYEYIYKNIYDLTPQMLVEYAKKNLPKKKNPEGSFLLVIDEAQRIFNSRDWQNMKNRGDWITFFAEHRHLGFDIVLVSQQDRMLDRQIRGLIEYEYIHRKVSNCGLVGKIFGLFLGKFVIVQMWYPMKEKISAEWLRADRRLYDFYDSFEDFSQESVKGCPEGGDSLTGDCDVFIEKLKLINPIVSTSPHGEILDYNNNIQTEKGIILWHIIDYYSSIKTVFSCGYMNSILNQV